MARIEVAEPREASVYDRLVEMIFSGEYEPGSKLTERDLAEQLQLSRVPIRESLGQMVAQGLLLGGGNGESVRMRQYAPDEVSQLYEFRLSLEVGAARAATRRAQAADIQRIKAVCQELERHVGEYGSRSWGKLDHQFHLAVARASHNERTIGMLRVLLTECHYVFYIRPSRQRHQPSTEEAKARMQTVQQEHCQLVEHLVAGAADAAERVLCRHLAMQLT